MTDTEIELVDTDAPADGAILRPSQLRRVEALKSARSVLENKAGLWTGSKVDEGRSVVDMLTLADWILTGADPYPSPTQRDASNQLYFESGWEAVRAEVMSLADNFDSRAAVDWVREHPAKDRLIPAYEADDGVADGPYPDENNGPGNP